MGIFDAATPFLLWDDTQINPLLPSVMRLVLWGTVGALVSMGLYRWLSAQDRIRQGKQALKDARSRLDAFEGPFSEAWPLIKKLLSLALGQVGTVAGPAIAASLPMLFLLNYLGTAYGYAYPQAGVTPQIRTEPARLQARWIMDEPADDREPPRIKLFDNKEQIVADIELDAPVTVIHKRQWWNTLIGNPVGYLPDDAGVERVQINLPRQQHLDFGPDWLQGWAPAFFLSLLAVSIILKFAARIE